MTDKALLFRSLTLGRFLRLGRDGLSALGDIALHNTASAINIIGRCKERGWNYRIPADIWGSLPLEYNWPTTLMDSQHGARIRHTIGLSQHLLAGVRLSVHASHFCVLGSSNRRVVDEAINEIESHSRLLDLFGAAPGQASPINVHINTCRPTPEAVMSRFLAAVERLSPAARDRLVVENDDRGVWTVDKIVGLGWTGPVTLDFHHYDINRGQYNLEQVARVARHTWKVRPIFHYSESATRVFKSAAHAFVPQTLAPRCGIDFDLDLEFKGHERAVTAYEWLLSQTVPVLPINPLTYWC
jgi:UV DNA damage endonuclease